MESWNVEQIGDREFVLLNQTGTLITVKKKARLNLTGILSHLEEICFPLKYSEGLREIKFTKLNGKEIGYYRSDSIYMRTGRSSTVSNYVGTLCHEIGHHIDEIEGISDEPWIQKEKRLSAPEMCIPYAEKNVLEYVACGFEVYYCGTKEEKKMLKKFNPFLHGVIDTLHQKYKSR